jgi:hypothetical protein
MGLRDRARVVLQPARAAEALERWYAQTTDVRAPRPGEITEYDPETRTWRLIQSGH